MEKDEEVFSAGSIEVGGARVHNLQNITVRIPRHKLSIVTGLSGSGKSSLVFDVLLAEGQRRYIETFSAYARGFLSSNERPDVDYVNGLSPVVSIEQKTSSNNPRSTVGTVTEIYDFLRLLYARVATPYSYISGKPMIKYTSSELIDLLLNEYKGVGIEILAPIVFHRKGHYRELLEKMRKKGYLSVFVDGAIESLSPGLSLDRYKTHYVAVLVDKLIVKEGSEKRLGDAVRLALSEGDGLIDIRIRNSGEIRHLSSKLIDPENGIAYVEPTLASFSFNSPRGWCPRCRGTGSVEQLDKEKLILHPELSLEEGAIPLLHKKYMSSVMKELRTLYRHNGIAWGTAYNELSPTMQEVVLYGSMDTDIKGPDFGGIVGHMTELKEEFADIFPDKELFDSYLTKQKCPLCNGARLNAESLSYRIGEFNISALSNMELSSLNEILPMLMDSLRGSQIEVAGDILKEIEVRLAFLLELGLEYLSLDRATGTLSGGEAQRIRLATQLGTGLVEVLYLLDEPGIGLHPRDNHKLIKSLQKLRDAHNTVIVVEHERSTMLAGDYLIDMGPGAGRLGGHVVFAGIPERIKESHTLTADYLNMVRRIEVPQERRAGNGKFIELTGACGNNLKNVDLRIPLGTFVCVTGVSGSGKSTLINDTLVPALSKALYHSKQEGLGYKHLKGCEFIDKLSVVDQSPIGRTPRSNPATYTGVFTEIRKIFVGLPESRARGYKPGRFSFNVAGGRCEVCKGNGYKTISMRFLPDVTVPCELCHGKRYTRETLEIRFKGKTISDVLDMTINQAREFFENQPKIKQKLELLQRVGLGYIKLGQPSTTLSGGEAQRVKLAEELSKKDTGKTLYVLDEPTTGLHFEDVRMLLSIIKQLVDKGNTVVIIEHDLDIVKCADYLIEMGPEGGKKGGLILYEGTPEGMISAYKKKNGSALATAPFLEKCLTE